MRSPKYNHVRTLLAARLAVVSFFMGLVVFVHAKYETLGGSILVLYPVTAAYALSIIYALALRRVTNLRLFVHIQLGFDLLLVSSIIFFTGGVNSPFWFMYILVIFAAPFLLGQSSIYIIASAASACYGLLLNLEYYELILPYNIFTPTYDPEVGGFILMKAVINIAVFYLVALLSASFDIILKSKERQLEKTSEDFTLLKAFHENVLENMGAGVIAIDLRGKILTHNLAVESILGLNANEIDRKEISGVVRLERLNRIFEMLGDFRESSPQFNWMYEKNDGQKIALTMIANKYEVEGRILGAIMALHDVTNIKAMEKQVAETERMASLGRVAAGIAHEIRNPLASLSGSIQMLSADLQQDRHEDDLKLMDIVMRETNRLNKIITQFLGYASPSKTNFSKADVSDILTETLTLLKANPAYSDKIVFKDEIDTGLEASIDHDQIRQVVWNLCVNAINAIEGNGALTIAARRESLAPDKRSTLNPKALTDGKTAKDYILLIISDTGRGIDPDDMDKIFEPFFTTRHEGVGLGLSTAYKIVENHSGVITATSRPGEGTSFEVWLPVEQDMERV
ncbi:Two-component sensor PilS [hydrothermal vent metagenome]|uniref:Two-component sensor PilS n=1 Tax=hydrothermal vent metagenome TaxID=652676 RepID=A0A3B1CR58_9ZZZZ